MEKSKRIILLILISLLCQRSKNTCICNRQCGNGQVNQFQVCDTKDMTSFNPLKEQCINNCQTIRLKCGNGRVNRGQICDFNNLSTYNSSTQECVDDCKTIRRICGNGLLNQGEICDPNDPNSYNIQTQECLNNCQTIQNICGNGQIDQGEVCDKQSFQSQTEQCVNNCQTIQNLCGNGQVDDNELCDINDVSSYNPQFQRCVNNCQKIQKICQDGFINNQGQCIIQQRCGNGRIDPGQQCDNSPTLIQFGCDRINCQCTIDLQDRDQDGSTCRLAVASANIVCDNQICDIGCPESQSTYRLPLSTNFPGLYAAIKNVPYDSKIRNSQTLFDFVVFLLLQNDIRGNNQVNFITQEILSQFFNPLIQRSIIACYFADMFNIILVPPLI